MTADVHGDFEFAVDTEDPQRHLIYVNHLNSGPSSLVVAKLDGVTGRFDSRLRTIADNIDADQTINGPEFVHPPGLGLGIVYHAGDGVHGVFRPAAPQSWDDFSLTVRGMGTGRTPPTLPSSITGAYDGGGLPLGQNTYAMSHGTCTKRCFASVFGGTATDAGQVLQDMGLTVPSIASLVQGPRNKQIYAQACTNNAASNATCKLYEATIDGKGGFERGSLHALATLPPNVGNEPRVLTMIAGRHPATGTTVLFVAASHESGQSIDVYEQKAAGGAATLVARVPVTRSEHYRVVDDGKLLVLHYLIKHGKREGSYYIAVAARPDRTLWVGQSHFLVDVANGTEMAYLPAAGRFAVFFRISDQPSLMQRCFFDP